MIKLTLAVKPRSIQGEFVVPGDKSIAHRALIFASLASPGSKIENLPSSLDVLNTKENLEKLGARFSNNIALSSINLKEKYYELYFGNSGTGSRLLLGLLASRDVKVLFCGDESLSARPFLRVTNILEQFGASYSFAAQDGMPFTYLGNKNPRSANINLSIPSAQIKSAIILAALGVQGKTIIKENFKTRDHTENMLSFFNKAAIEQKENYIIIDGDIKLSPQDLYIPGDPSSAAFLIALGILLPNSFVKIKDVNLNPTRISYIKVLQEMGANIEITPKLSQNNELIGELTVHYSPNLKGAEIEVTPSLIDEIPILALLCSFASSPSKINGIEELKYKESNRALAITKIINSAKLVSDTIEIVPLRESPDQIYIDSLDHRIIMCQVIMAIIYANKSKIDLTIKNPELVKTSFPNFWDLIDSIL